MVSVIKTDRLFGRSKPVETPNKVTHQSLKDFFASPAYNQGVRGL